MGNFSLVELGGLGQPEEDAYMRRFHNRALNCCDSIEERMIADVCLHVVMKEYRILENLSFPSIFQNDGNCSPH